MIAWPDLRPLLPGVRWVLIGSVATRAFMAERVTADMDVLIHEREATRVQDLLERAGYAYQGPLSLASAIFRSPDAIEVDVLFGSEDAYPWLEDALDNPEHDAAGFPVIALPYLVLLKMQATRDQDWTDITRMLSTASEDALDRVRRTCAQYSPDDVEDLETMIFLGRRELEEN